MIIGLLYLFFGALALWFARHFSREMRRTRDWPTTPGRILERGVGEPMQGAGRSFLPHVKYAYTVAGKEYVNDQVYVIRRTGNLADAIKKLVDGLPDPVPVHYNPQEPAQSYLLANPRATYRIMIGVGVLATLVGLGQLLVAATKP